MKGRAGQSRDHKATQISGPPCSTFPGKRTTFLKPTSDVVEYGAWSRKAKSVREIQGATAQVANAGMEAAGHKQGGEAESCVSAPSLSCSLWVSSRLIDWLPQLPQPTSSMYASTHLSSSSQ